MKTSSALFAIVLTAIAMAEESTAPPIDLEARKASVANLEAQIKQRQERLSEIAQEIITLDNRIEKRIASQVELLANLRDSQESRYRISQVKREAIEQLYRSLETYARKRAEMVEKIRQGDATALGDLDKFDERTLTRVEQIVKLTQSFPTHRDLEKYESDGTSYWYGYYTENTRISEEWRQGRRDDREGSLQRDHTTEGLAKAIETNQARRTSLVTQLEKQNLTDQERNLFLHEIGQKDALIGVLEKELRALQTQSGPEATDQPGRDEAIEIEHQLEDTRQDLRDDVSRLFRLYHTFTTERAKTADLEKNLEARKGWLKDHEAQ